MKKVGSCRELANGQCPTVAATYSESMNTVVKIREEA